MIIELKKDIINCNNFRGLNFLIQLCIYKNRYTLFVEIESNLLKSNEYNRLDFDDRKLLEETYTALIQNGNFRIDKTISNNSNNSDFFNLDEAIRYFNQPLSIILENSKNDKYFLEAVFKYFEPNSLILEHLANGWIQFENAGGCDNIKNYIEGKLQSYNNLPNLQKSKYIRCYVIMDSDKNHPDEELRASKKSTISFLDDNLISYTILNKRNMENYLPIEAYSEIKNISYTNWKKSFLNLTNAQIDFYNISVGFCKKDKNGNPKLTRQEVNVLTNNLYSNLSQSEYEILLIGLSSIGKFKENFPLFFQSNYVTKESLLTREGGSIEDTIFNDILLKINELL